MTVAGGVCLDGWLADLSVYLYGYVWISKIRTEREANLFFIHNFIHVIIMVLSSLLSSLPPDPTPIYHALVSR